MAVLNTPTLTCPACGHRAAIKFARGHAGMVRPPGDTSELDPHNYYTLVSKRDWTRDEKDLLHCTHCGAAAAYLPSKTLQNLSKPLPLKEAPE